MAYSELGGRGPSPLFEAARLSAEEEQLGDELDFERADTDALLSGALVPRRRAAVLAAGLGLSLVGLAAAVGVLTSGAGPPRGDARASIQRLAVLGPGDGAAGGAKRPCGLAQAVGRVVDDGHPCTPTGDPEEEDEEDAAPARAQRKAKALADQCREHSRTTGCKWTLTWSCPGQPQGELGRADDDGTLPYECCCGMQYWRDANGTQSGAEDVVEVWRVLDPAAVRTRPEADAELIGHKVRCALLRATRLGGWLRLAQEPGFVHIPAGTVEQLPSFRKLLGGDCAAVGLHAVQDHRTCLMAAAVLDLPSAAVSFREACHWRGKAAASHVTSFMEGLVCATAPSPVRSCLAAAPERLTAAVERPKEPNVEAREDATKAGPRSSTTGPRISTTAKPHEVHEFHILAPDRTVNHPSLFCYSVVRKHGYEPDLMREQLKKAVGIFACDEFAVFSQDDPFALGTAPKEIGGFPVRTVSFESAKVGVSKDGTAGNTQLFMNVWEAVKAHGIWQRLDFTMKVDPDAVLIPQRLRQHLLPYADEGELYVKNCNKVPGNPDFPMMFGALEIFSRSALRKYFDHEELCRRKLPWKPWGEDFYMTKCMDMLNVTGVGDFELLGDNLCTGARCGDGLMAAYHPFKKISAWFDCWGQASVADLQPISPVTRPPAPWALDRK